MLPPPPPVKHRMILNVLRSTGIRTFVETGTFYGDTTAAVLASGLVDRAFTIEADRALYMNAENRFRDDARVTVLHGDSATALPAMVRAPSFPRPALFWLDAHFMGFAPRDATFTPHRGPMVEPAPSGVTPVLAELSAILDTWHGSDDVVAIDDAHLFGFDPAYPRISDLVWNFRERPLVLDVVLDVIWIGRSVCPAAGIQRANDQWWFVHEE